MNKTTAAIFIFEGTKTQVVNSAAELLTGYSRNELLKMDFTEIIHPDVREAARKKSFTGRRGGKLPSHYELKIVRKDGKERWLDYSEVFIGLRGKRAVIGTAIDATERKSAEERLRRMANHHRTLRDTSLAVISAVDLKTVLEGLLEKFDAVLLCPSVSIIRIVNPQTGSLEARVLKNIDEATLARFVPHGGRGLTKLVLQSKRPVIVADALGDPRTCYPDFFCQNGLVSYLGLPLIVEDKILGDISFFTKKKHRFKNQEVELLMDLATRAAVAIHNSRMYDAMKRKTEELAALNALAVATTRSLDLKSVLQEAIKSIVELFHFDGARVYLFNEVMQEAHLKSSFETDPDSWSRVKLVQAGRSIIGQVARSGEPIIFEDILTDPRYDRLSHTSGMKNAGARFCAVFPIQSKLKSWGALSCMAKQPLRVDVDEVDLLTAVCNQIGIAIENASLYQNTAEKAKELAALYSVAGISAQFVDMNALLYQSMRKACEIFGFTAGRIYIVDEERQIIRLVAQEGFPESMPPPPTYRLGEGSIGKTIHWGSALTFADMRNDAHYQAIANSRFMSSAGFRAAVFIPLKVRGKTLGVMNLGSPETRTFSAADTQLINAIAYHLGIAVGNANLFSQLRQKTQDLEKANKAKDEFLSIMSHELRTPLNLILGYVELISQGLFGELNPHLATAVSKITASTRGLLSMIESILVTSTIETGTISLTINEFDLTHFLEDLKSIYELPMDSGVRLVWDIPPGPIVMNTDAEKLKRVLQNLIDNAIKFTEKGFITLSARLDGEKSVAFSVSDTGDGIAKDQISVIFDMFRQLDSTATRSHGGVGLGLYIVKQLTDLLSGKVAVESEPGKGSVFTVTIPLQSDGQIRTR